MNRSCVSGKKFRLLLGSSTTLGLILVASSASAQTAPDGQTVAVPQTSVDRAPQAQTAENAPSSAPEPATGGGEIVVTGSRLRADGFQSPNPMTVVGAEQLAISAPTNIADAVNRLPALGAGLTPRFQNFGTSTGQGGLNILNLRNLGQTRTLVLLDGRRIAGATSSGLVDVNSIPSGLVQRVDIVTGGVSAAYGSDAIAGVVNFVLDKKFSGLKLDVQKGISDRGDAGEARISASFGSSFADSRGHVLLSVDYNRQDLIPDFGGRSWFKDNNLVLNPAASSPFTAANPQYIQVNGVYVRDATLGGLIVKDPANGVLAGIQFGAGGAQSAFNFGTFSGSADLMIGGTPNDVAGLSPIGAQVDNLNTYGRVSFDVSPAVQVYAEGSYGHSRVRTPSVYQFYFGSLSIPQDNAFLPTNIRDAMAANGITTLKYGTLNGDIGRLKIRNNRDSYRGVLGLSAKLGGTWVLDAYGQYGRTTVLTAVDNEINKAYYLRAIDAVRNGAGQIVCRNAANGCVPLNIFGTGVASPDAIRWATGSAIRNSVIEQAVASASVSGQPFSTWAGPVALAIGGEYRKETTHETVDAISLASGWFSGNFKPVNGSYSVREGFAEVGIPLAKNVPFLQSLDVNAAIRYTDYSTSGGVVTWKAGITWRPINDLLFRVVRSRDIRAPNLADLYALTTATQTVSNPFIAGRPSNTITAYLAAGNPNLRPEKANDLVVGAVLTPSFIPRLSISIDYYNFDITGYITSLATNVQGAVDLCYAGNTAVCSLVTFDASKNITAVRLAGVNAGRLKTSGLDIELGYRVPIGSGSLSFRVLANYLAKYYLDTSLIAYDSAGEVSGQNGLSSPHWRGTAAVTYTNGGLTVGLTERLIGAGVISKTFTAANLAPSSNNVPAVSYTDAYVGYKVKAVSGEPELFVAVDNLFDKAPPAVNAVSSLPFLNFGTNAALYDQIGRTFRFGIRARF